MKRTGLFFGSFNPIHIGHLIVAEYFATQRPFDEIWLVVSPQNPLKLSATLASDHHRLAMAHIAVRDNPLLHVSSVEFDLPKPSYTIDTLHHLSKKFPDRQFSLLIGEDSLLQFNQWKRYDAILNNWAVEVFPRNIQQEIPWSEWQRKGNIFRVAAPMIEVSATQIRQLIHQQKSTRYLLLPDVITYIADNKLYC